MTARYPVALSLMLAAAGCMNGPSFLKQSTATLQSATSDVSSKAAVLSEQDGVLTAAVAAGSGATQLVEASADSAISGTRIAFPPGSLAVDTNIVVQEGAALASESFSTEIGLTAAVQAESSTVVIQSTVALDATKPFTVAISTGNGLRLTGAFYAVLYKVFVASQNQYVVGVIPTKELTLNGSTVSFSTSHFGAFQLVSTAAPVEEKKEIATTKPVVTKQEANAAPLTLDDYTPIAAGANQTVTIRGKNFRQTLTIALGSRPVADLKVMSDTAASFVMPQDAAFGFTDIAFEQDGVVEKHKLFALADKTDLPLITMDPAGVCAGVNYYDASGNKKTGTKVCTAAAGGSVSSATHADQADKAGKADFAISAGSAQGAQGPDVTITNGVIVVPTTGTFFAVLGGGTLSGLSMMPAGTKISLYMTAAETRVLHSDVAPKLVLFASTSSVYGPGDILEFTSVGADGWIQTGGAAHSPNGLYAEMDSTGTPPGTLNTAIPLVWNSVTTNTASQYNASTKRFTALFSGNYHIECGLVALFDQGAYNSANLSVLLNGQPVGNSMPSANGSTQVMVPPTNFDVHLNAGDYLEFTGSGSSMTPPYPTSVTFRSVGSAKSFLRITQKR